MTSLIVALLVAVFTVGYAFAWILNRKDADFAIKGASAGAYFDSTSGDGTAAEFDAAHINGPFVIANATHMRNLAVLQNTGRFGTNKYYFRIKDTVKEIDMGDLWLPPIGNDDNPFRGEFNGRGKSIKNLKVTTDKSLLTKEMYPTQASDDYEFSNAVGLFGNTHKDSVIRNFILNNPKVLIGDLSSTAYGDEPGLNEDVNVENKTQKVAGIAVGRVAGLCQSIGVRATESAATSLEIRVDGYSTFNSILGGLDKWLESSVTGGGHTAGTGGTGANFGSNFDVQSLVARIEKIKTNKSGANASVLLPDISGNEPISGEKLPFSVDSNKSTYEGAQAQEVVSNQNVGYFLGNQNKITQDTFAFSEPLTLSSGTWIGSNGKAPSKDTVPMWFYKNTWEGDYNTNNSTFSDGQFEPLSQDEYNELPDTIKSLLPADPLTTTDYSNKKVSKTFERVRISQGYDNLQAAQNYGKTDNSRWSYHGQISWMGKTYGEGFKNADGKAVDEDGNLLTDPTWGGTADFNAYTGGVALPNCAIWFKPSQAGKVRFVMYAATSGHGFSLLRIVRENADAKNPFKVDTSKAGQDIVWGSPIIQTRMPAYAFMYYEYDVDPEDIAAGNVEFMLMCNSETNGAYFLYMDLGANASEDAKTVVPDTISAVDFIYDGVEIEQDSQSAIGVGNFIVGTGASKALYDSSKTSIYFEDVESILKIVYLRLHNDTSGTHTGKTICLEGSDPELNTDSKVKATFATYVCPTIGGGSGTVSGGGGGGGTTPIDPGPGDTVAVESVSITGAPSTALKVGDTVTLGATITPDNATDKTVSWTTSNSNVATVANGVVTAKGAGTATITATAGGKEATVTITVEEETVVDPPTPGGNNLISSVGTGNIAKNVDIFDDSNENLTVSIDNSSSKITLVNSVVVDGVTYTKAFISNSNGAKVFTVKAKKKTMVTVYYCTTNNNSLHTAKPTLSGGTEQATTNENVYKVEATLEVDGTLTITGVSGCRVSILAIYIS